MYTEDTRTIPDNPWTSTHHHPLCLSISPYTSQTICIPDNPWMSTHDSVSPYTGDTHAPDHLHVAFYHMSFLFPDPTSGVWERDYIQACRVVHVTYDFPAGENGANFLLMEETLLQVLQLKSSRSCSNKHLRTFTYTLWRSTR